MIKVSVMYPNLSETQFDIEYYCDTHIPMVEGFLGDALIECHVDYGLTGASANEKAPYVAIAHLVFESVDSFQSSFGPHAEKIMADTPNYTNSQPKIQISEIRL